MDYKKEGWKDISKKLCQFCEKNQYCFPLLKWIPQPAPDVENKGHFMTPFLTPERKDDNTLRDINDYQPRVALRKMFDQNEISLNSQDKIEHFSKTYCVSAELVIECLTHFTNLQRSKRKRLKSNKRQKEQRKNNKYSDDWEDLITIKSKDKEVSCRGA